MLDEATRAVILRLHKEGHGTRTIARVLSLSRGAVKHVGRSRLRRQLGRRPDGLITSSA